ncbi:hypothetical protein HZU77_015565 [Neisseriaceae bacterium TC5R-5]|nr:hypothetical protein [Neisseriaceae bacterium TC5R-5]
MRVIGLSVLSLLLTACASTVIPTNQEPTQPPVLEQQQSCTDFKSIQAGQKVWVEFARSATLSQQLRESLLDRGIVVVAQPELASAHYTVEGSYRAIRPATKRIANFAIGDWVEDPKSIKTWRERKGQLVLNNIINPVAFLLENVIINVDNATGTSERLAQWGAGETGDPDGKCLLSSLNTCQGWLYTQALQLKIYRQDQPKQVCELTISMEEDKIRPRRLLDPGLDWVKQQLQAG